jgi:outer membrane protein
MTTVAAPVRRPDVIAALGKIDAAEPELKTRGAYYSPTSALSAQAYQNIGVLSTDSGPYHNINKPGGSVLLTLSIPLFDGGACSSRSAVARSQVDAARDNLVEVCDAAVQQVVGAYSDLRTSLAAYAAAVTVRDGAQIWYDAAFDAYPHGVGSYTNVANEQNTLARADSDKEDAHANVFTAAAALAFATGTIKAN